MSEPEFFTPQAAAIPYRVDRESGRLQVLLIRRLDGRKWGIPKGVVDPGRTHRQAAAIEALEEAGLEGEVAEEPVGDFTYDKYGGPCLVKVFAMRVTGELARWDEQHLRERRWFDVDDAARAAGRDSVRRLIAELARSLRGR